MDSWKRFKETSLPGKRKFYSSLNMEKNIKWKNFKMKNLGYYHDLYVQSDQHGLTPSSHGPT